MTWAQFKALTLVHITDRAPNETNFTASVAEFALARISRDVLGDANGYALRQNRYTATRRAIAGFVSTQNAATLKAAVRALQRAGFTKVYSSVGNLEVNAVAFKGQPSNETLALWGLPPESVAPAAEVRDAEVVA
jgi:hypothetical protein